MTTNLLGKRFVGPRLTAFVLILVSSPLSIAQDVPAGAKIPPNPRLAAAPNMSAWTIQYQYTQADPYPKATNPLSAELYDRMRKAYPRIQTVEVIKAGNKKEKVENYADGSKTTTWIVGDVFTVDPRQTHIILTLSSRQAGIKVEDDFYDLGWVDKAEYLGHQDFNGVDCNAYRVPGTDNGAEQTAYINAKSGLPQAIQTDDFTLVYSFRASSDPVELPEDVAKRFQAFSKPAPPKPF